jgi:hypothetical protein
MTFFRRLFLAVSATLGFVGRVPLAIASVGVGAGAGLLLAGGQAFATCTPSAAGVTPVIYCGNGGDTIDAGFGSAATGLLGYMGDAVGIVLLIFLLGLGIRMIVKWAHRSVSSS